MTRRLLRSRFARLRRGLYGELMKPVQAMTDHELRNEAGPLQAVYEAHLATVSDDLARATAGALDEQLSRYVELRSELDQRRGDQAPPLAT